MKGGEKYGLFNSMLNTVAGMSNAARQQRAIQLNQMGVELVQSFRYEEVLQYFLEAHELAPNDPTIKQNIDLCYQALKMIDEY